MSSGNLLLVENKSLFSPISQVNFEFYTAGNLPEQEFNTEETQCIVGIKNVPFGHAQSPGLLDYADGIDTLSFLASL